MRKFLCFCVLCASFALGLVLVAANPSRADDQAEARAVIDKAIQAMGGNAKFKGVTWKAKMTPYEMGVAGSLVNAEFAIQGTEQWRFRYEQEVNGRTRSYTVVLNGEKGWEKGNRNISDLSPRGLTMRKAEAYNVWLSAGRLMLLKDKAFALAPLGDIKVGDRAAVGVKGTHKNHPDISLFFDKETGLLIKSERQDGETNQEWFFTDYKEVAGEGKYPSKVSIKYNGNLAQEHELTEFKSHEMLDDSVFDKP